MSLVRRLASRLVAGIVGSVVLACPVDDPTEHAQPQPNEPPALNQPDAFSAQHREVLSPTTPHHDDFTTDFTSTEAFEPLETNGRGTPATWGRDERIDAPSPPYVFGVQQTSNLGQTYNLSLLRDRTFDDVDIHVLLYADTGQQDRGGGIAFRARDANNYLIARWNPLEHNARFYVVESGYRRALAKVDTPLDPTIWHTMRVTAVGSQLELFLDDELVLTATSPPNAPHAGRVGLWTKADAVTWFDDLLVTQAMP